jgi:Family of unknown function (DUF6338)
MQVTFALVQLSLLFLPGLIWAAVDSRFVSKKPLSQLSLMVNAFLFGVASYAVTFLLYSALGLEFGVSPDIGAQDGRIDLSDLWDEIVAAVVVAVLLSVLWVYSETYRWLMRFLLAIKATKRYGDEDGYVAAFSETDRSRELMLRAAEVHDFGGRKLFSMPHIYLALAPQDVHIEFPYDPSRRGADDAVE